MSVYLLLTMVNQSVLKRGKQMFRGVAALAVLMVMLLGQPRNRAPRWWYYGLPLAVLVGFAIFTATAA